MNLLTRRLAWFALAVAASTGTARIAVRAQSAPAVSQHPAGERARVAPESVGISSARLVHLHRGMQAFVDRHEAAGIVTLIAREGKVVDVHAVGFQDVEKRVPMRT